MANTKSAAKRARQTVGRTNSNTRALTAVKNQLKTARATIKAGDKAKAQAAFREFASTIDKAVKTGRVHPNSANRHKSALNKAVIALG